MGKRKRPTTAKPGEGQAETAGGQGEEEAVKDDMAHVSPDVLAGSPDVFASKPAEAPDPEEEAPAAAMPAAVSEPVIDLTPEPVSQPVTAPEAPPPPPADSLEPAGQAPQEPPPSIPVAPAAPAPAPPVRRTGNTGLALGVVLVVVGLFALAVAVSGIDLTQYGWPLFIIVPGLTLLVVGFVGAGAAASIPGGIITMFGLVLAYQSSTGDWASWSFAWSAVTPFGVGLGMYLQALRDRDMVALRRGRALMFIGLILFIVGFVFFESIIGVSGRDYGVFGKAALPLLLIVFGIILLVRSTRRARKA
ncbi:MAG: hypothetical protein ACHQ0J_01045 [Candidatus Dormibacterales bacterium]